MRERIGNLIQAGSLIACLLGIVVEFTFRAPAGMLAVTVGAVLFAIGTKLKGH